MAEFSVFGIVIATFISLIQVQYKEVSAFDKHSAFITIFIIALFVCVSIVLGKVLFGTPPEPYGQILDKIRLLVMAWAMVSLILIVSPFLGWFIFVIWVFFVARVMHQSYQELYQLWSRTDSTDDDVPV